MKRSTLIAAVTTVALFAACDDNTGNEGESPLSPKDIAGTYDGYSYSVSAMQAFPWVAEAEKVTITVADDNTASLAFASTGQWGTYSVEKLLLTPKNGAYEVSGSGKVAIGGMGGGAATEYEFTVAGTISTASQAELRFVASVGGMGDVTTTFVTGSVPSALKIVGKYSGYTKVNSEGKIKDQITAGAVTTVTYNEEAGTVNLTCATNGRFGSYTVEKIPVGADGDNYTVSGNGTVKVGMTPESAADYEFTMSGVIRSLTDANVVFTVAMGAMGEVTVEFITGEAPAAGE